VLIHHVKFVKSVVGIEWIMLEVINHGKLNFFPYLHYAQPHRAPSKC
jgi:hypothetical protein